MITVRTRTPRITAGINHQRRRLAMSSSFPASP
jgi:hypothetical protein